MKFNNIIEIKNVSKIFNTNNGHIKILDNLSLSIKKGDFVSIMGRSGSGKSTLLSLIGGIDRVSSGSIIFNGNTITTISNKKLSDYRLQNISYILQDFGLLSFLTVEENIAYTLFLRGVEKERITQLVNEAAVKVCISDKLNVFPSELSGGQQQRVAIARALASTSKIVIADEPTASLDQNNAKNIIDLLNLMREENNSTIILSSHDINTRIYANNYIDFKNNTFEQSRND